jgi:hypothetical protein
LSRRLRNLRATCVTASLPTTTQRFVQRHGTRIDRRFRLGKIIIRRKLHAFGIQQFQITGSAFLIADTCQIGGALALFALRD